MAFTGILGRSGLARFILARIPSAADNASVPCPYRPYSLAELSQRPSASEFSPIQSPNFALDAAVMQPTFAGAAFVSVQIPLAPPQTADAEDGRPAQSAVSPLPQQAAAISVYPAAIQQNTSEPAMPPPGTAQAGAEAVSTQEVEPAKSAPESEQFPKRKAECR